MSIATPQVPGRLHAGVLYPTHHEPKKMAESPTHLFALARTITLLRVHFRAQPTTGVFGDVLWFYDEGNLQAKRAPDLMVIHSLQRFPHTYSALLQWLEDEPPCFIMEITSDSTRRIDLEEKRQLYEEQGVQEYLLFDPNWTGPPAEAILLYRLLAKEDLTAPPHVNGIEKTYERIFPEGGRYFSTSLGLWFEAQGQVVDLIRPDGTRLLDLPNALEKLAEVQDSLSSERLAHRETKTKLKTAADQLQSTKTQLQNAETKLQTTETKLQNTETKLQDAETKLQTTADWAQKMAALLRQQGIRVVAQLGTKSL
jgi:Uma2 family endonuclease